MKKLSYLGAAFILLLIVACGDDHHHERFVHPAVVDILSDPTLDGDITLDLTTGGIGAPAIAANNGSVVAGINVSPISGASLSESRAFLIFRLAELPVNASIQFASITVFIDSVSFVSSPSAPIPFFVDSIDTTLFPPPLRSTDFDAPFRETRTVSFFGRDAGNFVEIDVTSLLIDAQAERLPDFEVRFAFDEDRFQNDRATTRGLIEIDDLITNTSRAPVLHVEFF